MKLVPAVTSAEMAAVDQAMVEDYGIDLIQMMENAGQALAALLRSTNRTLWSRSAVGRTRLTRNDGHEPGPSGTLTLA